MCDARIETLENACRQARACLLNLMPDEINPMQRQMQKMVNELSKVLELDDIKKGCTDENASIADGPGGGSIVRSAV